MDTFPY